MFQDNEDDYNGNYLSSYFSVSGIYTNDTQTDYCVYTGATDTGPWPNGSYCVAQFDYYCPSGFDEGFVYWDDEDTGNTNSYGGYVPSGNYKQDTRIYFCCRDDRSYVPMRLPTGEPFLLYLYGSWVCQDVVGMSVSRQYRYSDDENDYNANAVAGSYPRGAGYVYGNQYTVFCYYY